jgi:hypothetical protein
MPRKPPEARHRLQTFISGEAERRRRRLQKQLGLTNSEIFELGLRRVEEEISEHERQAAVTAA